MSISGYFFSIVFILICCFLCGFYFTIKYLAIFTVRVFFRLSFVSNISFIFSAFPAFFKIFSPRDPCSAHGSWITKYKLLFTALFAMFDPQTVCKTTTYDHCSCIAFWYILYTRYSMPWYLCSTKISILYYVKYILYGFLWENAVLL